jgi:steroid delta-isomerase-like uncharacterized protein
MATDIDTIRRLNEEAFVAGNLAVIDDLIADNFVDHDPPPGVPPTKEGVRLLAEAVVGSFSDRKMEFDDYFETTDGCVVENWAMIGTHTGDAFGLPASGQQVRVRGMEAFRCEDGKLVEHWGVVDMSDVAQKAMG